MSSHPSVLVNSTVSSILIDGSSGGLELEQQIVPLRSESVSNNRGQGNVSIFCLMPTMTADWCSADQVTIDILPDDVLLELFSLCGEANRFNLSWWKTYVHVCRRWRQVIFASPLHLRLVLDCNPRSPVRRSLNIWPPLPIAIRYSVRDSCGGSEETMATFEHRDHVSEISIYCPMSSEWKKFAMAMLGPFPALTSLVLVACNALVPVLPETFLGGSAPSLRTLILDRIPFPALPKLLSSATRLVSFRLRNVPGTGYISPEAMAACLAALPCLKEFRIETQTDPLVDGTSPSSHTPAVLPSLTLFHFKGIIGYLEHLVARIDSPKLTTLSITSYGRILHIPQLHRFISHASKIKLPNRVVVEFYFSMVNLKFMPSDSFTLSMTQVNLSWQVPLIALVCRELSPLLSRVERLHLHGKAFSSLLDPPDIDPTRWLELFRPFVAVQNLYISKKLEPLITPALQTLTGERSTEVLPELRTLLLKGPQPSESGSVMQTMQTFITARRLFDHPVAIE